MHNSLRTVLALLVIVLASPSIRAATAPAELTGTWQGKLQVDPKTQLTIQFTLNKRSDGTYTATVTSPGNDAIKDVVANKVTWKDGVLQLEVKDLSGSYSGTFKDGAIEGQWKQPGGALPLTLHAYERPSLAKADLDTLSGTWVGPAKIPNGTLTFVIRIKPGDQGDLQGSLSVPEQGNTALQLSDIQFSNGRLTFTVPRVNGAYQGTYANGVISGNWHQLGGAIDVTLKKGEYAASPQVLKLSVAAFAALTGTWKGTLEVNSPKGPTSLPLVLIFGTNEEAAMTGFLASPSQNAAGIPITEATLTGSKLVVKVPAISAEYDGDLKGRTLTGQWHQGPLNSPLTFTKQ